MGSEAIFNIGSYVVDCVDDSGGLITTLVIDIPHDPFVKLVVPFTFQQLVVSLPLP